MFFRFLRNLTKSSTLLLAFLLVPVINADWFALNMTRGITDISNEVFELHMLIFWICVAIGALVFSVMFYSMWAHTKKKNPVPAKFHENHKLEIAWTIIPFLILIAMAVPASKTLVKIYDDEAGDINIQVTGYQWKWQYKYLEDDVSFFSNLSTDLDEIYNLVPKGENYLQEVDEMVVIPAGKKVRFLITANDVIHSWWVPEIAVKRDAIPGFINEAWTRVLAEGVYRGQCTELCGAYHGFMPVEVHVVGQDEFDDWMAAKKGTAAADAALAATELSVDELMARGEDVYNASCLACHGANGEGGLGNAIAGSAIAMGGLDSHLNVIVNGVAGTAMQAFGAQLSDVDVAAVTTYQRNAFGNNTGDVVQASDVVSYKEG